LEPISSVTKQTFLDNWLSFTSRSSNEIPSYSEIHHPELGVLAKVTNSVESSHNPLDHSEILAIRESQKKLASKYLIDCCLITSLEPCLHCSGAIIKSRLNSVVYFLPTRLGDGISSLPVEMIYNLNHFPKVHFIRNDSVRKTFHEFFLKKR
jgi:tRNA(Arg) A34 adenosine deaminase TadA